MNENELEKEEKEIIAQLDDFETIKEKSKWPQKKEHEKKVEIVQGEKNLAEDELKWRLAKSEISILVDTYDDIFSDFDPRPYNKRILSDDFLRETKKELFEMKSEELQLILLIPEKMRNTENESLIKRRLKEHFRKNAMQLEHEMQKIMEKGIILTITGFSLLLAAGITELAEKNLLTSILFVIMEPSGWFMAWFGLETLFYGSKEKKAEHEFNKKMGKTEIIFNSF